mmetsp:Transcript_21415/g.51000  ORF Transcript_21415/g.51000 Transcript_21415/m.51000 type:complete len:471 (-) Transcript_21415:330-1742(-)
MQVSSRGRPGPEAAGTDHPPHPDSVARGLRPGRHGLVRPGRRARRRIDGGLAGAVGRPRRGRLRRRVRCPGGPPTGGPHRSAVAVPAFGDQRRERGHLPRGHHRRSGYRQPRRDPGPPGRLRRDGGSGGHRRHRSRLLQQPKPAARLGRDHDQHVPLLGGPPRGDGRRRAGDRPRVARQPARGDRKALRPERARVALRRVPRGRRGGLAGAPASIPAREPLLPAGEGLGELLLHGDRQRLAAGAGSRQHHRGELGVSRGGPEAQGSLRRLRVRMPRRIRALLRGRRLDRPGACAGGPRRSVESLLRVVERLRIPGRRLLPHPDRRVSRMLPRRAVPGGPSGRRGGDGCPDGGGGGRRRRSGARGAAPADHRGSDPISGDGTSQRPPDEGSHGRSDAASDDASHRGSHRRSADAASDESAHHAADGISQRSAGRRSNGSADAGADGISHHGTLRTSLGGGSGRGGPGHDLG